MVAAAAISNFLTSAVSIPFAHGITGITAIDLFILAMFGFFQVALGLTLFFLGSRLLPSGQAALISTLETPLMPFWIWLAFAELPGLRVLLGGALVMGAVIADIIGDRRTEVSGLNRCAELNVCVAPDTSARRPRSRPSSILAHRIVLELGELAGRLVDRVSRHAVGQLAGGQQIAAGRIDAEAARLFFGGKEIDRCQHSRFGIDLECRKRAGGALGGVEIFAVRREVDIRGPRLAFKSLGQGRRDLDFLFQGCPSSHPRGKRRSTRPIHSADKRTSGSVRTRGDADLPWP